MKQKVKFHIAPINGWMQSYRNQTPIAVICEAIIAETTATINVQIQVVNSRPFTVRSLTLPLDQSDQAAISELREMQPNERGWIIRYLPEELSSVDIGVAEVGYNFEQNGAGIKVFIQDYLDDDYPASSRTISALFYLHDGPGPIGMELHGLWSISILSSD